MTGVHDKGLLVSHCSKVLHYKPVLRPVLEYSSVSSICDQFMWMLCNPVVKVVLDHRHYCCRLCGSGRIFIDRTCVHLIIRTETVHVYASVLLQFICKLGSKYLMVFSWEISEGIPDGKNFFLVVKDFLTFRSVINARVVRFRFREYLRNTFQYFFMKLIHVSGFYC